MQVSVCPVIRDSYTGEQSQCLEKSCAWWLGDACAVTYIGANCRSNVHPWHYKQAAKPQAERTRTL